MKIDASLSDDIGVTQADAARIESSGYAGAWTAETKHDPFLQSLQAAMATETLTVGTAIVVAFGRSPMTLANAGYDLALYSRGRFVLGLGSQIKPHIERRFSMPWSNPAARMRELILATRAIWAAWHDGVKLDFRGDFYSHTLMTPFFTPEPHEFGPPPVYLAGVGEKMTEVAGEVADGFFVHPFTTMRYLEKVTIPALLRGRAKAGKGGLDGFVINGPSFVTIGRTEDDLATAIRGTKTRIAFYGSTPAYRQVLEIHGWGDAQDELNTLSKQGRWDDMADVITDEMLHEFSIVGTPAEVGPKLVAKVNKAYERITFYSGYNAEPSLWADLLAATK
ncbi:MULTISPECIES: LLM class F420-dependent oxidoreductase [unclassified Pseudofrankia]|uniref:LLM class F420-dependent oxidoreductase n=1 Tax=unclassified Pseudofrankia TaxID=2994372 RepID=UPI0008DB0099|nr:MULTISPECIES: LLM class F420-dependent oxidoreductase [unclassified Pseudofrankia]MDT3440208.1 LLM class F420-dependent oxidoreductase [Pseudofrankia sp. BMG5.37]OHV42653.1 LLM class F420-dependent oxidoreductase [Pseudofrankia sp. BMG5.36]